MTFTLPRKCGDCGTEWLSRVSYSWVQTCPKCNKVDNHIPKQEEEVTSHGYPVDSACGATEF